MTALPAVITPMSMNGIALRPVASNAFTASISPEPCFDVDLRMSFIGLPYLVLFIACLLLQACFAMSCRSPFLIGFKSSNPFLFTQNGIGFILSNAVIAYHRLIIISMISHDTENGTEIPHSRRKHESTDGSGTRRAECKQPSGIPFDIPEFRIRNRGNCNLPKIQYGTATGKNTNGGKRNKNQHA